MVDVPEIRIGTAERERALEALTQHFSDGRLTVSEFDERSGRVTAATTRAQLDAVFADLPALSAPTTPAVPRDTGDGGPGRWRETVMALTPFLALGLFFLVPGDNSWMFFLLIPVVAILLFPDKAKTKKKHRRGGGC